MRMQVPQQIQYNRTRQEENQEVEQVKDGVEKTRTQTQPTQNAPQRANDLRYCTLWENNNLPMKDPPSFIMMEDVYPMRVSTLVKLPTFHGMESENPYSHVHDFKALCQSLLEPNTSLETMQLTFFLSL